MTKQLTEQQLYAVELLALPQRGGKSLKEIAIEVGVADRTLQRWRADEQFSKQVGKRIIMASQDQLGDIMASIPRHIIDKGNAAMFRTLLQAYGLLSEKVEVTGGDNESKGVDLTSVRAEIARYKAQPDRYQ